MKPQVIASRFLVYAALLLLAALFLTPLLWLIAAVTKTSDDLFTYTFFAPRFSADAFRALFKAAPFGRYLVNSVFLAASTVTLQLFFSSLAGFALAKYDFKGKQAIMLLMLATVMIPSQVTMAPLYEQIYRLGLVDTYPGLIIPSIVSVFGIFLFRQAMLQVPDEMLHAARIDGCSEFRIYWDVVMPVQRPIVGAFCLVAFMSAWNSFLWPQIILHSKGHYTVPIGLNQLIGPQQSQYGAMLAGTFLSVVPVALLFLLLQKEFVAGLSAGSIKG